MRKRVLIIAANLAVVLTLVGGTVAYATMSKTVTLSLDGKETEVHTFGDDVGDVLASEGVELADRDVVLPAADESDRRRHQDRGAVRAPADAERRRRRDASTG